MKLCRKTKKSFLLIPEICKNRMSSQSFLQGKPVLAEAANEPFEALHQALEATFAAQDDSGDIKNMILAGERSSSPAAM
jgi:hypothetical protein